MNKLQGTFFAVMLASSLMLFTDVRGANVGSQNTPNEIAGHGGHGGGGRGGMSHGGNWGGRGDHGNWGHGGRGNWNHGNNWNRNNFYGGYGYGVGFGPGLYGGYSTSPYYDNYYYNDDGLYYSQPQGEVYIDLGN